MKCSLVKLKEKAKKLESNEESVNFFALLSATINNKTFLGKTLNPDKKPSTSKKGKSFMDTIKTATTALVVVVGFSGPKNTRKNPNYGKETQRVQRNSPKNAPAPKKLPFRRK